MMNLLFGSLTVLFLAMSIAALVHLRWARRLPSLRDLAIAPDGKRVRCSVVLAARDEEERIERTIRLILAQSHVEVEVIVVDDRSTDRTSEILERLAAEDARLRTRRVETLPDGWLGKCYACQTGAKMATGEWILFTDADCWLKPDIIERALRVAAREKVEHVALTPGAVPETIPGRAWHLAFLISFANWFSGVNRAKPRAYFGMGAFNLIQTAMYHRCGGYEALRLTVLDDVRLGLLVRRAGGSTRAFIGGEDVECHWGRTARAMIGLMEKNYFAGDGLPNRSGHRRWNHCIACRCSNPWRPIHRNVGRYGCTRRMVLDGTAGRGLRPPPGMGNRRSIDDAVRLSSIVLCDVEVGGSDPSSRRDLVARNILFARAVACWRSEITEELRRRGELRRTGEKSAF